ncbi:hypothetical protein [Pseudomonas vancouverensis]|uniref:Lipoprotein n=1 Tax=Pseudomonas vancouverensis TaxID=95300 RepID=A0A1H2NY26_PSEVA|nr:hypothetical protein [Pseudomonas vancouverensis]KAB0496547.1 hypothetical protein F7R09_12430 [Pseudomonas vancouverensis]TDB64745.1 hypothetical protein EIY72_10005 [Pseudomonas vancouverensis]SDV10314.1 hypothetical protein SAMN05216558_3221 [Pseudomonas vancouverensis]
MNTRNPMAALMTAVVILGCTNSSSQTVTFPLSATPQNLGQIANTTLASQGNQTGFTFVISGVPSGTLRPLNLYTSIHKGSCKQPGPVAYEMNDRINTNRISSTRGWTYSRSAPVALSALFSGDYYVVVTTTPADGNIDIFCGDLKQTA